jgi:Spy/CpxP family protein refolding chaperone
MFTFFSPHRLHFHLIGFALLAFVGVVTAVKAAGWADSVPWQALDLTPQQAQTMQQLDAQWQGTYSQLQPQIEQDQTTLKRLIQSPSADSEQVMHVQTRLQRNRDALHQSATRIFMEKKERLTPQQRQRLHKMMDR